MNGAATEPAKTESHDSESTQGKSGSLCFLWVFLGLLIYVLGIGPAAKFAAPDGRPAKALEAFYSPLILLAEKCKPVDAFLEWYVADIWHCDD
jgi:hypothetical protein